MFPGLTHFVVAPLYGTFIQLVFGKPWLRFIHKEKSSVLNNFGTVFHMNNMWIYTCRHVCPSGWPAAVHLSPSFMETSLMLDTAHKLLIQILTYVPRL